MKIYQQTFKLILFLLTILLVGCNSEGAFTNPESEPVTLNRIDISPSPIATRGVSQTTLVAGGKQHFVAIGYYSNGESKALTELDSSDWVSSDSDVAFLMKRMY